jgi:hypothetical protein
LIFPLTGSLALRLVASPDAEEPLVLEEASRVYFMDLDEEVASIFNKMIHTCSDDCVLSRNPMTLDGVNCMGDFALHPRLYRHNLVDGIGFGLNVFKCVNAYGSVELR